MEDTFGEASRTMGEHQVDRLAIFNGTCVEKLDIFDVPGTMRSTAARSTPRSWKQNWVYCGSCGESSGEYVSTGVRRVYFKARGHTAELQWLNMAK